MYFSPAHSRIESIAETVLESLTKSQSCATLLMSIERIRSPIQEIKFLGQLESFKCTGSISAIIAGYHGTCPTKLDSIIDNGLYSPYMNEYKMSTGNKYGHGVYVSETFAFAKNYSRGCMIVAAIATGYSKKLTSVEASKYSGKPIDADSFIVSPEIILRGATQALPLFIINGAALNTGTQIRVEPTDILNVDTQNETPCSELAKIPVRNNTTQISIDCANILSAENPNVLPCVIEHLAKKSQENDLIKCVEHVKDILNTFDYESPI